MFSTQVLCDRLRAEGKKVTPQRRLIYQALEGATSHPRAETIYAQVRAIIPDISLATVYKTLRELVISGELLEINFQGEHSRFDPLNIPHNHLVCTICQRIEDVMPVFDIPEPGDTEKKGFQITQSEIVYYGLCADCKPGI